MITRYDFSFDHTSCSGDGPCCGPELEPHASKTGRWVEFQEHNRLLRLAEDQAADHLAKLRHIKEEMQHDPRGSTAEFWLELYLKDYPKD